MVGVNWYRLSLALEYYQLLGYQRLDLPWTAPKDVCAVTCPEEFRGWDLGEIGRLVGSAEQSFMAAQFRGDLPVGKYVSLTPCFRNEPVVDETHQPYFMKVELYASYVDRDLDLQFAEDAQKFFREVGMDARIVSTDIGYDLEVNGIEVGSYSCREHAGHSWTCGTGIAEPRLSIAFDKDPVAGLWRG